MRDRRAGSPRALGRLASNRAPRQHAARMSLVHLPIATKARLFGKFIATKVDGRPTAITLELTRRCNAKCDYCDHWREAKRKELTTEDWIDVVRHFDPLAVTICGGEPFIRQDVLEIARGIKKLPGYRYLAVITNGWFLNEKKADELMATGIDQINVSLNWPDERQDDDRKLEGLWDRISHIVPWMTARGANVQLNTILMKENLDEIRPIVDLAERWRALVLLTLYSELPGSNATHSFPTSGDWVPRVEALCKELLAIRRARGVVANETWYLEQIPHYLRGRVITGCTAGKETVHVTPEGMVRICADMPVLAHYKEYDVRKQPWTDCTACFQACRGEAQAPVTPKRVLDYLLER
jgi:pyrroloquinoline quinone biosynthesis protein E